MFNDQQTHTLPVNTKKRGAIAALTGAPSLHDFDQEMQQVFRQVHTTYSALFPQSAPLSTQGGSLVFTGVDDDPATLETLRKAGFENSSLFLKRMREWHGGRIRATQSARARALLTRLGPDLVAALAETQSPDHAFAAFTQFFESLNAGVQPLSLLCNRSKLLSLLVNLLNTAPKMAKAFSNRVSILDAMLDPGFSTPLAHDINAGAMRLEQCALENPDFETLLNETRRTALEERLRINVQVLTDKASSADAAQSYSALAEAAVCTLAQACQRQVEHRFGPPPGEWAILGMGSLGAKEMHDSSDIDLFTLYEASTSVTSKLEPAAYFSRFTQRLISALSAQTQEGSLYAIDMKLRPSGQAGPVAVSWPAFIAYYAEKAWTWEVLALGRARVVAASSDGFQQKITAHIAQILAAPRDPEKLKADITDMRQRIDAQFSNTSPWDLKHAPGGLLEIELMQQFLRLSKGVMANEKSATETLRFLQSAHTLQFTLLQILGLCLGPEKNGTAFPTSLQDLLARRAKMQSFSELEHALITAQNGVRALSEQILT